MSKPLSWIFELIDKMGGPARQAARGVTEVEKALNKARDAQSRWVKGAGEATKATKSFGSSMGGLGLQAFGWMQTIKAVGGAAMEVGKFAFHAQAFKEDTLLGLEIILQSKEKAAAVLGDAMKFAAATPFTTTQVMGWTKDLLVGGFNPEEAKLLMTVAGDFGALKGDDEYVQRVIFQLTKLNAVGKLTGETMMQLGEAGLPVQKVYEALAKRFGTTVAGVQQLQAAGRIDSGSGINAIVEAIAGLQGGKVGTVLSKRSTTLSGLWSTLSSRPEELFMAIGGSGTGGAKSALQSLADTLDPASPSGQRIVASLTKLSDTITKLFIDPLSGPEGAARIEKTITAVTTVFEGLAYVMKGIGAVVAWLWEDGFLPLGDHIAHIAFVVWKVWDDLVTWFENLPGRMTRFGTALVEGFVGGIKSAIGWVEDAVKGVADAAVWTLKQVLGIHSPSKVFEGLGLNVAAGFEQGVDGGASGATASVESMVKVPRAGGAGGGVSLAPGSVVVTVNGAGPGVEDRVREAVLQALASAFEQLGLEAGVA